MTMTALGEDDLIAVLATMSYGLKVSPSTIMRMMLLLLLLLLLFMLLLLLLSLSLHIMLYYIVSYHMLDLPRSRLGQDIWREAGFSAPPATKHSTTIFLLLLIVIITSLMSSIAMILILIIVINNLIYS